MHARRGSYQSDASANIAFDLRERYFTGDEGEYKIVKHVRDGIIFAKHNPLIDLPFSRLDLIVCRNTLRFQSNKAQAQLLSMFFQSLCPDGLLLLDAADAPDQNHSLFQPLDGAGTVLQRRTAPPAGALLQPNAPAAAIAHHPATSDAGDSGTPA
ncbi:MAG TPA: CheR family methyltransferase, partial [Roseiflexaceae bacterium]|nr:CheR family methyltransferase [Roseiflexaceae bacterium]